MSENSGEWDPGSVGAESEPEVEYPKYLVRLIKNPLPRIDRDLPWIVWRQDGLERLWRCIGTCKSEDDGIALMEADLRREHVARPPADPTIPLF